MVGGSRLVCGWWFEVGVWLVVRGWCVVGGSRLVCGWWFEVGVWLVVGIQGCGMKKIPTYLSIFPNKTKVFSLSHFKNKYLFKYCNKILYTLRKNGQ